ncbi:MAG: D-glycero-alpha-D-manno-heptose-1,7-bisphosphate 7-phosphatase [Flavobacteriales bacterium]
MGNLPPRRKAIFLDRDGIINHDPGDYTRNISEFTILPTVLESLKILRERGFVLILITNQGGIAKGIYSHKAVDEIHEYLKNVCDKNGTPILDIYYSPHHEITGKSLSRKPGSMMIERAVARYNIDPKASWMVGDKQRDLDCASPLGVPGVLIPTNDPLQEFLHLLV